MIVSRIRPDCTCVYIVDNIPAAPYNPRQDNWHWSVSFIFGTVLGMTTVRQLYELQELDLKMAECNGIISSVGSQIGDRAELDAMHQELDTQSDSLNQLRVKQRSQELDVESVSEKLRGVEGRLYGGTVTNLRELGGFEKEATFLRDRLKELDNNLLDAMEKLEDVQGRVSSLEDKTNQAEEYWQVSQKELAERLRQVEETLSGLETSRQVLVSQVGPQELKLYESLRLSKRGVAIAKVERGLCRGCRMTLPTNQLQRARAGRETVFCNSCGRILYVS